MLQDEPKLLETYRRNSRRWVSESHSMDVVRGKMGEILDEP
jgi:hypothetical protein